MITGPSKVHGPHGELTFPATCEPLEEVTNAAEVTAIYVGFLTAAHPEHGHRMAGSVTLYPVIGNQLVAVTVEWHCEPKEIPLDQPAP